MPTKRAEDWAFFLKRLGLTFSQNSIMRFVDESTDDEVWKKYIEADPYAREACRQSHINCPEDLKWWYGEISYAHMRFTFPKKSHGRGILGPKIVTVKDVLRQKMRGEQVEVSEQTSEFDMNTVKLNDKSARTKPLPDDLIGKRLRHKKFGVGTIVGVNPKQHLIVKFVEHGEKLIMYFPSIEKGIIKIL